jgi:hypothetical protein
MVLPSPRVDSAARSNPTPLTPFRTDGCRDEFMQVQSSRIYSLRRTAHLVFLTTREA